MEFNDVFNKGSFWKVMMLKVWLILDSKMNIFKLLIV